MIDIDDVAQLGLHDRSHLLQRAAQAETRWQSAQWAAQEALKQMAQTGDLPALPARHLVLLQVPAALHGVGQALQTLFEATDGPTLRLWDAQLAALPLDFVVLSACPRQPPSVPSLELSSWLDGTVHPAQALLFLLAFLDQWTGTDHLRRVEAFRAAGLEQLARCRPEVPLSANPVKQISQALSERVPLFWAEAPLQGVVHDWWRRYHLYAEAVALQASSSELTRTQVMARFPHYWPQAVTFVHLEWTEMAATARTAPMDGIDLLLKRRRMQQLTVPATGFAGLGAALWYLLELGEWVALYAACLNGIDPADRVPQQFLEAFGNDRPIT